MKHIIFLLLLNNFAFSQDVFKNETLGFEMKFPKNWNKAKEGQSLENIKGQIKLSPEKLQEIIVENKGTLEVVTFYKYPVATTAGIIPTIKVNFRKNFTQSFDVFKKQITASFLQIKDVFPDFKFSTNPYKTEISGLDCVSAVCSYTIKTKNSEELVKITVYAIPVKDQFYQITFMDSEEEDNEILYQELAQSIKIY